MSASAVVRLKAYVSLLDAAIEKGDTCLSVRLMCEIEDMWEAGGGNVFNGEQFSDFKLAMYCRLVGVSA